MASVPKETKPVASVNILNSWKEIASFLGRGVRTVQRWESENHLPVHRVGSGKRSPVHAFPIELLLWAKTLDPRIPIPTEIEHLPKGAAVREARRLILESRVLVHSIRESTAKQRQHTEAMHKTMLALRHLAERKQAGRPKTDLADPSGKNEILGTLRGVRITNRRKG